MVQVQLGSIQTGGWEENVGIFSGQNIQNSWDAHSVSVRSFGGLLGDFDTGLCAISSFVSHSVYGQPTYDNDVKGNASTLHIEQ